MDSQGAWFDAKVAKMQWLANGYLLLDLYTPPEFSFQAGQYTVFRLIDSQGAFECHYSIASSPAEKEFLQFCIFSKMRALEVYENLNPGQTINIKAAAGNFQLQKNGKPKVFVAGGTGISPLRSMIESLFLGQKDFGKVHLLYGCQSSQSVPFFKEFEKLENENQSSFKAWFCSEKGSAFRIAEGRVTAYVGESLLEGADYYISGPPAMVTAVEKLLVTNHGVLVGSLFKESY